MLKACATSGLIGVRSDAYQNALKQNPVVSKIGNLDDSNTLLNLNMPDTKEKITREFEHGVGNYRR